MAHSKSNSGVKDLNSKSDWSGCFDKIDAAVDAYNKDHPEQPVSFDRSAFENDDKKLGQTAAAALSLRIGDVSKDSHPDAVSQSGEQIHVDRSSINDSAGNFKDEVADADISRGDAQENVDSPKSRQVHAGEQNIIENHTVREADGAVSHEITVMDGNSAPKCTQEAITDHIGELASAPDAHFETKINFNGECSEETKASYNDYRDHMENARDDQTGKLKYANVSIHYPWDD